MARRMRLLYLILSGLFQGSIATHFATYVLFLTSRGLNIFEASLVNLVYAVTLIFVEFPTGIMADTWGRKPSFVAACFIMALGCFIYGLSHSFWEFALAEGIAALGATCATGAFDAWIVDTLKFHGSAKAELNGLFVRANQVKKLASIVGVLVGSKIAEFDLAWPWFLCSALLVVTGVIAVLAMREEYLEKRTVGFREGVAKSRRVFTDSLAYAKQQPNLRFIFLVTLFGAFSFQAYNMQWQPFFGVFLGGPKGLGWFFVAIVFLSLLGVTVTRRLFEINGYSVRALVISNQIFIAVTMAGAALAGSMVLAAAFFLVHEVGRGAWGVLSDVYLNREVSSKDRASLISLNATMDHLGMMTGLVLSGYLGKAVSTNCTWLVSSAVLIATSVFLAGRYRKNESP
jgi:MFS family permease